jgi:hypothetical protein
MASVAVADGVGAAGDPPQPATASQKRKAGTRVYVR